jgi:superfamily I DNA/RNA helicase
MLAEMMVKRTTGRMIWVGDRHQAIYGFTGADSDAVDLIMSRFQCVELPLTVTYRCPKEVVNFAQNYVSHIEAHESAPVGLTREKTEEDFLKDVKSLKPEDAILCRKTAPLIKLAYSLIRQGVGCHVEGRDIGKGLLDLVAKWKRVKTIDALMNQLQKWEDAQVKRAIEKKQEMQAEHIKDRAETLRIIATGCETILELKSKINSLFQNTEDQTYHRTLTLSTVHKAKGREWGNVYILGFREHMPSKMARLDWQKEQEKHLIYVAVTRAQESLTLVG